MSMAFFLLFFLLFFLGMFLLFSFSLKRQEKNQEELLREQKAMRNAMDRLARLVEKSFEELPVQEALQHTTTAKQENLTKTANAVNTAPATGALSLDAEKNLFGQSAHAPEGAGHLELAAEHNMVAQKGQAQKNMQGKSAQNSASGLPELKL